MTINNQAEFEALKKIGSIVANCLALLKSRAVPGISTLELDQLAYKYLTDFGAISAPKITYNFPGFTCISVEKDCAHGIPSERVLKEGDLINVDVSASLNGFFADNGESFVVGKEGQSEKHKLCNAVNIALTNAIKQSRAGARISSLGRAVNLVAKNNNFKVIKNLGGHGVGLSLHDEPKFIAGYEDKKDRRILKENQVIAFEPFLSTSCTEVKERNDGWTLFTSGYTAQREHTFMITKNKPYIFTRQSKSFV